METGDVIADRYRLGRRLDSEDGQCLYLAEDMVLKRPAAIRLATDGADPDEEARLRREGELLAATRGPDVVEVLAVGDASGPAMVVTDILPGSSLGKTIRAAAPLPVDAARDNTLALIDALMAVQRHRAPGEWITHRSVMLTGEGGLVLAAVRLVPADPDGADPAVRAVCETLFRLLTARPPDETGLIPDAMAGAIPDSLRETVRRGLAGEIGTLPTLRDELSPSGPKHSLRVPRTDTAQVVVAAALALVLLVLLFNVVRGCSADDGGSDTGGGEPAASVTVPDIGNLTEKDAVARVEDAGLTAHVTRAPSETVQEGHVSDQTPDAGESTPEGSRVVVTVSEGPTLVPVTDVRGLPLRGARRLLNADGFRIRNLQQVPSSSPRGSVVAQDPRAGALAPPGTEVSLTLSAG